MTKGETKYGVKIGTLIVKETTSQKEAKRVFQRERGKHGGKVKFFEIKSR